MHLVLRIQSFSFLPSGTLETAKTFYEPIGVVITTTFLLKNTMFINEELHRNMYLEICLSNQHNRQIVFYIALHQVCYNILAQTKIFG